MTEGLSIYPADRYGVDRLFDPKKQNYGSLDNHMVKRFTVLSIEASYINTLSDD